MSETTTLTLVDFLLARIAEDEEAARLAVCQCGGPACTVLTGWYAPDELVARLEDVDSAAHVAHWSPARILVECEAKRRRVTFLAEMAAKCPEDDWPEDGGMALAPLSDMARHLLRLEALPHADHPDYREEWRP